MTDGREVSVSAQTNNRRLHSFSMRGIALYVLAGFVLPWIVIILATIYYRPFGELVEFPSHLFGAGYNYFLVACLNAIPFAAAAVAAVIHAKWGARSRAGKLGIVVGALVVLLISAFYQVAAWSNLIGPHPDALTGIAFYFLPWVGTIAFVVSAVAVWLIAELVFRVRASS